MAKSAKKKSKKNKQQQLYNTLQLSIGFGINVIILIVLVQAFYFAYQFSYDVFSDTVYNLNDNRDIAITVDSGASSMEVAALLEEKGVVEDKYVAFVRAKLTKAAVMPGTYVLQPSMTLDEIYEVLGNTEKEE